MRSCIFPRLPVVFTRQLEILVTGLQEEFLLGTALVFAKRDISQNFSKFQQKVLGEISARLFHLSTFFKRISIRKEKLRNFNLRLH